MSFIEAYIVEFEHEAARTRKLLKAIPNEQLEWQPHEKSMTFARLGMHIGNLNRWIHTGLTTTEIDFSTVNLKAPQAESTADIVAFFEQSLEQAISQLKKTTDEELQVVWKATAGGKVFMETTRKNLLKNEVKHIVHHRGQLTVFFRMVDAYVPGLFGPSADDRAKQSV
ncbi:MAG TPA: damage-inducible protein DinB [Microscillaceae bacterium]|nr:damage-inducible protein DinB [Microscillaceae bacterium]